MSLAKQLPLLGIIAGIALSIVGFNDSNTALIIVGIVLIALGFLRTSRKV
jgi:hypothetical protein